MKKEKEISIIIPAFNCEKTIERCINSILNQTIIDEIEIIIIDDGSKDNTLSIIKKYEKSFPETVKVLEQKNSGPSIARNNGIKNSKGKYIGFVDGDDYIDSTMYESMKSEIIKDEIDLVIVGRYNVGKNGKAKPVISKNTFSETSLNENPSILSKTSTFVWDKLYKKEIIENNYIKFPENLSYAEDFYFLTLYKYYSRKISIVKEPLYYYITESENSITNTCNKKWLDIIKTLDITNKFFIKVGEFDKYKKELQRISMGFFCRRIQIFKDCKNKKMQIEFVKRFYEYFELYFSNWKKWLSVYGLKKPKKYRTNLKLMTLYIYLPNIVKRFSTNMVDKKNKIKKYIKKLKMNKTYYAYCRKKYKVKEKEVFFMSYYGGNITDSPYYMMKNLTKDKRFKIYVASRQPAEDKLYLHFNNIDNVEIVKVHSKKFVKLLSTAKFIINNSRLPEYVIKRENQIFINTWHGTPLKTLGRKINKGLKDIGNNQTQFLMSDYLLYPNEYTKNNIMRDFCLEELFSGKVILSGYPRNEMFFSESESQKMKKELGLEGKKIYVYMPTWRGTTIDTTNVQQYKEELEKILKELDDRIENAIVFVKLHQIVMKQINLEEYENVKNINSYYETYNFLNMADALITDYSSVFFDFANSKKEIILFMYDYEKYMQDRGMYFDIKELPFTKIYNIDDLVNYININNNFEINHEYKKFLDTFCSLDSEKNSQIVNDIIFRNKNDTNRLISFKENRNIQHTIIFCTNIGDCKKQEEFERILENMDDSTILVFKQKTFNNSTNNIIHNNDYRIKNYIIVPDGASMTISDKIFITMYRKLKIFKSRVSKIYKTELERILPNISIKKIQNYTTDKKFKDIENLFKKGYIK